MRRDLLELLPSHPTLTDQVAAQLLSRIEDGALEIGRAHV